MGTSSRFRNILKRMRNISKYSWSRWVPMDKSSVCIHAQKLDSWRSAGHDGYNWEQDEQGKASLHSAEHSHIAASAQGQLLRQQQAQCCSCAREGSFRQPTARAGGSQSRRPYGCATVHHKALVPLPAESVLHILQGLWQNISRCFQRLT